MLPLGCYTFIDRNQRSALFVYNCILYEAHSPKCASRNIILDGTLQYTPRISGTPHGPFPFSLDRTVVVLQIEVVLQPPDRSRPPAAGRPRRQQPAVHHRREVSRRESNGGERRRQEGRRRCRRRQLSAGVEIQEPGVQGVLQVYSHKKKVHSVAWNTGTKLASGSIDHIARVWSIDPHGHSKVKDIELKGHTDSVDQLCWDPKHPETVATAAADKTIRLWDARSG